MRLKLRYPPAKIVNDHTVNVIVNLYYFKVWKSKSNKESKYIDDT